MATKTAKNVENTVEMPQNADNSRNYTDVRGKVQDFFSRIQSAFQSGKFRQLGSGASLVALQADLQMGQPGMIGQFFADGGTLTRIDKTTKEESHYLTGKFVFGNKKMAGRLTLAGNYDNATQTVKASELADLAQFEEIAVGEEFAVYAEYRSNLPDGRPYIPAYPIK